MADSNSKNLDIFLVCGLGSLGQHCIISLKRFGVKIVAIEIDPPNNWEIPKSITLLNELIIGDCRNKKILRQAKVESSRAALIVTNNELINVETAIAIRQLNSKTRILIRSQRKNLDRLLGKRIDNFVAFDPFEFPTSAFALAGLGKNILGFFQIDGKWLRIVSYFIKEQDKWCKDRKIGQLNSQNLQVLTHNRQANPNNRLFREWESDETILITDPQENSRNRLFHQWEPDATILSQDRLITVELDDHFFLNEIKQFSQNYQKRKKFKLGRALQKLRHQVTNKVRFFLQSGVKERIRQVAFLCLLIVIFLIFLGAIIFKIHDRDLSFLSALKTALILLNGGYADLFADLFQENQVSIPWWLDASAITLNLVGTLFLGILYAWLTQELLAFRFNIIRNRPPIPKKNHIVVIGLGRLGQKVVNLLHEYKQSIVAVSFNSKLDGNILPTVPLIVGNLQEILTKANLDRAKSVLAIADNEMENLEVALTIESLNPNTHLAVRTYGRNLSQYLNTLLPKVQAICPYEEVSKTFAGAPFGENILYLFRIQRRTIMVTEYQIQIGDTLEGLLLADLAYGYGVVSILYQKSGGNQVFLPSEDLRLNKNDRLVILATIEGLRRIELGQLNFTAKSYRVLIEKVPTENSKIKATRIINRVTNCGLHLAREAMKHPVKSN